MVPITNYVREKIKKEWKLICAHMGGKAILVPTLHVCTHVWLFVKVTFCHLTQAGSVIYSRGDRWKVRLKKRSQLQPDRSPKSWPNVRASSNSPVIGSIRYQTERYVFLMCGSWTINLQKGNRYRVGTYVFQSPPADRKKEKRKHGLVATGPGPEPWLLW